MTYKYYICNKVDVVPMGFVNLSGLLQVKDVTTIPSVFVPSWFPVQPNQRYIYTVIDFSGNEGLLFFQEPIECCRNYIYIGEGSLINSSNYLKAYK